MASDLDVELLAEAGRRILSEGTRKVYENGLKAFNAWCADTGEVSFPASVMTVEAFIESCAGRGIALGTIRGYLAAIQAQHFDSGLMSPTKHPRIQGALVRLNQQEHQQPRRKKPLEVDGDLDMVVAAIRKEIDEVKSEYFDLVTKRKPEKSTALEAWLREGRRLETRLLIGLRDLAIILVGFAGALRRSEIASVEMSDLEKIDEGLLLTVRGSGRKAVIPFGVKHCPVDALRNWLEESCIRSGCVFRQVSKGGKVMEGLVDSGGSIARIVKARAEAAGLNPEMFSAHSLRSGYIDGAMKSGLPIAAILSQSGKKSLDLSVFERPTPDLLDPIKLL